MRAGRRGGESAGDQRAERVAAYVRSYTDLPESADDDLGFLDAAARDLFRAFDEEER